MRLHEITTSEHPILFRLNAISLNEANVSSPLQEQCLVSMPVCRQRLSLSYRQLQIQHLPVSHSISLTTALQARNFRYYAKTPSRYSASRLEQQHQQQHQQQ